MFRYAFRRVVKRVACQMGVASHRPNIGVAEQIADDCKALDERSAGDAERCRERRGHLAGRGSAEVLCSPANGLAAV